MVGIGDRVDVNGHHGVVKYVGYTEFAEGVWYGIELDESVGRNDGSVQGKKYFELEKQGLYGIFAKIQSIKIANSENQSSLEEEISRLLQENAELRGQLQKAESEGPNDIIEFLTMETSDLNKNIEFLKGELAVFQQKEDTHVKLQAVYVEMERELRYQLDELEISYKKEVDILKNENAKLIHELNQMNTPQLEVRDLRSKLKIMEHHVYENRFLKDLYEVALNGKRSKEEAQFEYLSERILDGRIRNNFVEKQKCRFLLVILSGIAAALTEENVKESFSKGLGDVSQWVTPFLACIIPGDKIQITPINRFLESNPELGTNLLFAIRCMEVTFGKIVPELLAFYMEHAVNERPLKLITELYSVCLSIQKKCETLRESISKANCTITSTISISIPNSFNMIFQELFVQFEFQIQDDHILELTKRILQEVESICVIEKTDTEQKTIEKSEEPKTLDFTSSVNSHEDTAKRYQKLLHNKEMEMKELMVKIQVYEKRLEGIGTYDSEFNSMKIEISQLGQRNEQLTREVMHLKDVLDKTQEKVRREQLRGYQIGPSKNYDDLTTELFNSEKLDLISEIRDLRQIVSKYIVKGNEKPINLEWLNIPEKTIDTIDVPLSNKIHYLENEVLDLISYSTSVNLECNKLKKNYMENAKFKVSAINSTIKDIK